MKRILRQSALAGCIVAAVWMAALASSPHNCAYAQQILVPGQNAVYYNGYGQGYYGGYVPGYSATYTLIPNNGYSAFGNGPYGNYPSYGNPVYYGAFGGRTYGASAYRASRDFNYYRGF
jgi:hypothetical protein